MMVCRIVAPRRNQVNVDVEQFVIDTVRRSDPILRRFTARNAQRIAVAIAVPAQLQPPIEFAVMGQQHVGALRSLTTHAEPVTWPLQQLRWKQFGSSLTNARKRVAVSDSAA